MGNNPEQVNSFLEKKYERISRLLRNGELFSSVQSEEVNVTRTIENLERTAGRIHQTQVSGED